MDVFAHTLWTGAVFYKKYKNSRLNLFLSAFFGVLPDLVSFSPVFIYGFLSRKGFLELINSSNWTVNYARESYNYTHSAIIFLSVLLLVLIIKRKVWWPMFGWLLHIFIDIFTHKGFFETPFLFPISDYRFSHGTSWGEPHFMVINYAALAATYILIFFLIRKRSEKSD